MTSDQLAESRTTLTTSGVPALVDRDEPFAKHLERPLEARADPRQVFLVGLELGARPLELGLLGRQFGFERRLALAQDRDFAEHRVDRRVLFGDRRASELFALADLVELALGRVELFLQGLGGATRAPTAQSEATASSTAAGSSQRAREWPEEEARIRSAHANETRGLDVRSC